MAKYGSISFKGGSGSAYKMIVFPFQTKFKPGIGGVYLVTKRRVKEDGSVAHEYLYVGSSSDLRENFRFHPRAVQFDSYKATSICVYRETDEAKRKEIFEDLRGHYRPLLNEMF